MTEQQINYGNWVPRNLLYLLFIISIIPAIITLFPIILIIKVILWVLAGIFFIFFIFMVYIYLAFAKNNGELQNIMRVFVIEKLLWDGNGKALDVGTGAGALAIKLAKQFPKSEIWGIDYWGKGWNFSKKLCEKNALAEGVADRTIFQKASASKLPFKDDQFDAVVSNYVYHEVRDVKDKKDVIKESFRVLKKGGFFSLQDLFLHEKKFGEIENLKSTLKEWGIKEVNSFNPIDHMKMNRFLRNMFRNGLILYGQK